MNHLNKIEFTVYLKSDKKYSFFNHMEQFKKEDISDLFIFHKDKVVRHDSEKQKIKDRVDRWIKEKSDIIPDKESWEVWRLAKLYDECKADYEKKEKKPDVKHNTLIHEVNYKNESTPNPFDKQ